MEDNNTHKLEFLQQKLSSINPQQKVSKKLVTNQYNLSKLLQCYQQQSLKQQYKINQYLDKLKKLQILCKQYDQKIQIKQYNQKSLIAKIQKNIKKNLEKATKDRRDNQKKIQMALEGYLIELAGLKGKTHSNCLSNIRELQQKQSQIQHLNRQIQNDQLLTKQIMKKIYAQFTIQMQQINDIIEQQKKQRQNQQDKILQTLQNIYSKINISIKSIKKSRQKNQKDIVDLLERIIQRIKNQLINQ